VSKNTYLCHYKGTLGPIAELSFVQIAVEYPPEVKIERGLNEEAGGASLSSESPVRVHIVLHQDADLGDIKPRVASAAEGDEKDITWEKYDLEVEVKKGKLSTIAQISDVRNIHKVRPVELASNDARETISASVEVNWTQYLGSGEIIAVADSGLDKIHHAFRGRIHDCYNIYGSEVRDRNGHGTHVSGSVLGSGSLGETLIQGVAPEAKLIAQSCMDQGVFRLDKLTSLSDLFGKAYDSGARVHTNSWGSKPDPSLSVYNYRSEQIDDFVWEHQDMVVCFAAGNQRRKIQAEAASKNCITVGVTEDRADDLTRISEKEYVGNNYGPTATNRAKPDIFAPGKLIQSARSRDCHRQHDGDVNWCRNTGTSMANALVAGCAGVLRQVIKISSTPPRAALVKAILICGADHLDQSISTSKLTSFRRVNLAGSVQISVAAVLS